MSKKAENQTPKQEVQQPPSIPPNNPWFIPNDDEASVYRFILAAARRARQLQSGARPSISTTSRKSTKIAMEEIRQGAVDVEITEYVEPEVPEDDDAVIAEGAN